MNRIKNKSSVKGIAVSPAYYLGKAVWSIVRFFFLLGMTFIILYPIMYMLSMALRDSVDMYDSSVVWIPRHFTLENFKLLFTSLDFLPALKNSAIITIVCTLLQTLVCAMTGNLQIQGTQASACRGDFHHYRPAADGQPSELSAVQ